MKEENQLTKNTHAHPYDRADLQSEGDYDGGVNIIYIGLALPGAALSDKKWQIEKHFYDGSGNWIKSRFAAPAGGDQDDQTNLFVHAWDDRASLVYTAT